MPVISLLFSHSKKETNSRNDSSTLNNFNKYIPFDSKNTKLIYLNIDNTNSKDRIITTSLVHIVPHNKNIQISE